MPLLRDEIRHSLPGSEYHIIFVPGNPGLISYYTAFLSSLSRQLNPPACARPVSVYGKSLSGFEVASSVSLSSKYHGSLIDLDGQVSSIEKSLHAYCAVEELQKRPKLILMGHSVGAYIVLEVLRRHKTAKASGLVPFDIVAEVLLFPTVIELALSPRGKMVERVATMRYTYAVVGAFARALNKLLPSSVFSWAVRTLTSMPPDGAAVTEAFLKSELGVREALYLARTELLQITTDKWSDEIWEPSSTEDATDLFFYFGRDDPWVANDSREKLISTRGNGKGVKMEVDELNIPHAFCISHSELVAGRVSQHVSELSASNTI